MTVADVLHEYLAAVTAGDRRGAFRTVERARAQELDLRALYLDVFQPALREIGRLWQENQLTVAEEHLATAITQSAMLRLYGGVDFPDDNGRLLIAACAETERHEIGIRMLCDFLDLEGWETVFLGSCVPIGSLVQMIRDRQPDVVALSASIAPHLPQLRATIAAIRGTAGMAQPVILVGGRPFLDMPELATSLGADLVALDAAQATAMLLDRFA